MKFFIFTFFLGAFLASIAQNNKNKIPLTPYEKSIFTKTATYDECNAWYDSIQKLFRSNTEKEIIGYGDIGLPIYLFKIIGNHQTGVPVIKILINNNIHPGEPEGTDASMLLCKKLLTEYLWQNSIKNMEIHIICQYNVDGTDRRNCCSRANQNGPVEVGFRGNAKNLDLNRDFIKMDSRNAEAFVKNFVKNKYQILVDNHTSNGADYQYILTYFHTRPEKLHKKLQPIILRMDSTIKTNLLNKNWPTSPYVETMKTIPDSGIHAFWETGRYATGFAALHHCMGFCVETHMLKKFSKRVDATLVFMEELIKTANHESDYIYDANFHANYTRKYGEYFGINYQLNTNKFSQMNFRGYESSYKMQELLGMKRLFYDTTKPFIKSIKYYNQFNCTDSIKIPKAYFIPQAYKEVIQRLQMNGVQLITVPKDTLIYARCSYIKSFETVKNPYENHYLHYNIQTRDTHIMVRIKKGDFYFITNNGKVPFVINALEPRAPDSYFAWNFFDGIVMQKEGFSDYVFVDKAAEILENNPSLKEAFFNKKKNDASFAKDDFAQLLFIYKNSEYYEQSHNLYPVYRLD